MTQTNLCTKQKWIHRQRTDLWLLRDKWGERGTEGEFRVRPPRKHFPLDLPGVSAKKIVPIMLSWQCDVLASSEDPV